MGIGDRIREFVSGEETGETFDDEFEDFEEGGGDPIEEETSQEVVEEWETCYAFCEDVLEEMGFSDVREFIDKAMIYRIDQSPLYRDRIESGVQTMDSITSSMERIHGMREDVGGEGTETDYEEMADQVRGANQLMDQMDRLGGKEEQIVDEMIGVAHDFVDAWKQNSGEGGSVRTGVEVSEEDI